MTGHAAGPVRGCDRAGWRCPRRPPREPARTVALADVDGDGDLDLFSAGPRACAALRTETGRFVDGGPPAGSRPGGGAAGAVAGDVRQRRTAGPLVAARRRRRACCTTTGRASRTSPRRRPGAGAAARARPRSWTPTTTATSTSCWPAAAPIGCSRTTARPFQGRARGGGPRRRPRRGWPSCPPTSTTAATSTCSCAGGPARCGSPEPAATARSATWRRGRPGRGARAILSVAAGDINKDGFTDFFFGGRRRRRPPRAERRQGPLRRRACSRRRLATRGGSCSSTTTATACWTSSSLRPDGLRLLRNLGTAGWTRREAAAALPGRSARVRAPSRSPPATSTATATPTSSCGSRSGALRVLQNRGRPQPLADRSPRRPRQQPQRRRREGGDARGQPAPEARDLGGHARRAPADLVFGLGRAQAADAVRVLWPAGILQTELPPTPRRPRRARRRWPSRSWTASRRPARTSTPGTAREFAFVTDFMGGGEMGYWQAPGAVQPSRPRRIRAPLRRPAPAARRPLRAAGHQRAGGGAVRRSRSRCSPSRIRPTSRSIPDEGMRRAAAGVPPARRARRRPPVAAHGRARPRRRRPPARARPPLRGRLRAAAHPRLCRGAPLMLDLGPARRRRRRRCC